MSNDAAGGHTRFIVLLAALVALGVLFGEVGDAAGGCVAAQCCVVAHAGSWAVSTVESTTAWHVINKPLPVATCDLQTMT
ncbi:hypothetical protein [Streptomyces sp. NPDC051000]|uniref:hypothetical protein n=1 Tax=Streptomyces sp. NPDC051000 TaxID=3155520 RepID=UPI0033EE88CE